MKALKVQPSRLRPIVEASGWRGWTCRSRGSDAPLEEQFGQPGLWRASPHLGRPHTDGRKGFLYPPVASLPGGVAWARDADGLDAEIHDWAHATSTGKLPTDWTAVEPGEASSWIDPARLNVRAGPHLAKGKLECDAKSLRIVFPELVVLNESCSDARVMWAHELCLDAQSRWQIVRFGVSGRRVRAEVDLSGVPASLAQPLFALAFASLEFSVRWTLPSLALVSDPDSACLTLDCFPPWRTDTDHFASPHNPARPSD